MANALYPKFKEFLMTNATGNLTSVTIKATLIDLADYTYNSAHDYYDDITSGARVSVATLSGVSVTNGVFDASDITFTSVTGDVSEALVLWIDTAGAESTDMLIAYIDAVSSGLPVTPNGGNITVTWDDGANKIFAL